MNYYNIILFNRIDDCWAVRLNYTEHEPKQEEK
jgi:hypothetical protein